MQLKALITKRSTCRSQVFQTLRSVSINKKGRLRQKMAGSWKGIGVGFPQRTLDLCGNVIELSMIFSHGQLAVGTTGALGERRLPSGL